MNECVRPQGRSEFCPELVAQLVQSADRAMAVDGQEFMHDLELFADTSIRIYEGKVTHDKAIRQKLLRLEAEQYK